MRTDILGVEFDKLTAEESAARGRQLLKEAKGAYVVTPNPEIVFAARKNPAFAKALSDADIVLPDGIGVVYASKILGHKGFVRLPGIEFGSSMLQIAAEEGYGVYLLGAKPGVAEKAAENLRAEYPGLIICGTADGYFKSDEPVAERIKQSGARLVFVCLGFPKQELWIAENRHNTGAALHLALGGSLDVFAGNVKRAPDFWCRLGLEWFYRLIKEPQRIKRMWKLPYILILALGERIKSIFKK